MLSFLLSPSPRSRALTSLAIMYPAMVFGGTFRRGSCGRPCDDNGQFGLVVELFALDGAHDRVRGAGQRGPWFEEHDRQRRGTTSWPSGPSARCWK